jgi:hypothetical protein
LRHAFTLSFLLATSLGECSRSDIKSSCVLRIALVFRFAVRRSLEGWSVCWGELGSIRGDKSFRFESELIIPAFLSFSTLLRKAWHLVGITSVEFFTKGGFGLVLTSFFLVLGVFAVLWHFKYSKRSVAQVIVKINVANLSTI